MREQQLFGKDRYSYRCIHTACALLCYIVYVEYVLETNHFDCVQQHYQADYEPYLVLSCAQMQAMLFNALCINCSGACAKKYAILLIRL